MIGSSERNLRCFVSPSLVYDAVQGRLWIRKLSHCISTTAFALRRCCCRGLLFTDHFIGQRATQPRLPSLLFSVITKRWVTSKAPAESNPNAAPVYWRILHYSTWLNYRVNCGKLIERIALCNERHFYGSSSAFFFFVPSFVCLFSAWPSCWQKLRCLALQLLVGMSHRGPVCFSLQWLIRVKSKPGSGRVLLIDFPDGKASPSSLRGGYTCRLFFGPAASLALPLLPGAR